MIDIEDPSTLLNPDFADPTLIRDAINAALVTGLDRHDDPQKRLEHARHLTLLDAIYGQHLGSENKTISREAATAGVAAAILRVAHLSKQKLRESKKTENPTQTYQKLQEAIKAAASMESQSALLNIAEKILEGAPSVFITSSDEIRVVLRSFSVRRDDREFKIYEPITRPVPLVPTPVISKLEHELKAEFPWFSKITDAIVHELRMAQYFGQKSFRLRPILIAGEPGTGKTRFARRLAQLIGTPFHIVPCAGSADGMSLRGTSRGWASARPGVIVQLIAENHIANPIVVLDELEKASHDPRNGRIWDVALQLLERETATRYFDECLEAQCNLSWVSFIACANTLDNLPRPLLERFMILRAPSPRPHDLPAIINGTLRDIAHEFNVPDPRLLPELDEDDREYLRENCISNPREIGRLIRLMLERKIQEITTHCRPQLN